MQRHDNLTLNTKPSASPAQSASRANLRAAAALAVFGLAIIWAVGFSPVEVLHNAAHDTRHSNGFPCH